MIKATLHFQKTGARDDILCIYDSDTEGVFRVTMRPGDFDSKLNEFYITSSKVLRLVSDILTSLSYDVEPFQYVQVTTELSPSVLYAIRDIEDECVRELIEDTIEDAIHTKVRRISA